MADKAAQKAQRKRQTVRRALTLRSTNVARWSESVLGAPDAFWSRFVDGPSCKIRIAAALKALHKAEAELYAALGGRAEAMVRRQVCERECWDFLAAGRSRLGKVLGRSTAEWVDLAGCGPISHQLGPRLEMLCRFLQHLGDHPAHQDPATGFTTARARRIACQLASVLMEIESFRARMCLAARDLKRHSRELKGELEQLRSKVWATLLKADVRWAHGANWSHGFEEPSRRNIRLRCAGRPRLAAARGPFRAPTPTFGPASLSVMGALCCLFPCES